MRIERHENEHQVSTYDLTDVSTGKMFAIYYALKIVEPTPVNKDILIQIENALHASGQLVKLGDITVHPDQSYTVDKKKFILGYLSTAEAVDGRNLTLYKTKEDASMNSEEWCVVEAATEEEARANYEVARVEWIRSQPIKPNGIF